MSTLRKSPPSVGVGTVHEVGPVGQTSRVDSIPRNDAPRGLSKLLRRGNPASRSREQQHQQQDHRLEIRDQPRSLYALMHRKQQTRDPLRPALQPVTQHPRSPGPGLKWDGILRQRKVDLDDLFEPGTYIFTTQAQLLEDLTMLALHVATLLDNTDVPPLSRRPETVQLSGREKEAKLMYELRSSCLGVVLRLTEKGYAERAKRFRVVVNSAVMSSDFLLLPDSTIVPNFERCNVARQLEYGRMLRHWIAVELEILPAAPEAERIVNTSIQGEPAKEQKEAGEQSPASRVESDQTDLAPVARDDDRKQQVVNRRTLNDIGAKKAHQSEIDVSGLFESRTCTYTSRAHLLTDLHLTALHIAMLRSKDVGCDTSKLSISAANSQIDKAISDFVAHDEYHAARRLAVRRRHLNARRLEVSGERMVPVLNPLRVDTRGSRTHYAHEISRRIQIESVRLFGPNYARSSLNSLNGSDDAKRQNQAAMEALVAAGEFGQNPYLAAKQEKHAWADKQEASSSGAQAGKTTDVKSTEDPLRGSSKGRGYELVAISAINWADVPEDEVRQLAEAYNASPSPADSGIAFPRAQQTDAAELYVGKGKGRASESEFSGMPGAFPPSPQHHYLPRENGMSLDGASLDSWTDLSDNDDESQLFQLPRESLIADKIRRQAAELQDRHTKALQDAHMAQELAQRLEHDSRIERELMEVEDARVAAQIAEEETAAAAEAARMKAAASLLKSCVVCGDEKLPFLFPGSTVSMSCTHEILTCNECLQSWLTSELDSRGTESIKCPECPSVLTPEDFLACAPLDLAQKFDRLLTRATLSALPGFAWCLAAGCESGQVNVENASYMKCVACSHEVCLTCKVKWHQGKTCAEYGVIVRGGSKRRKEEEKSEKLVQGMSKICPGTGCGARIEKGGGCDHMTCRKCRWEFCWQCLASQKEIKRVGNTAHKRDCKFHSENLDITWPFNAH
ncbi:hypothetical protein LTR95_006718 [Oleoguttula sp. CCFEE 5521]